MRNQEVTRKSMSGCIYQSHSHNRTKRADILSRTLLRARTESLLRSRLWVAICLSVTITLQIPFGIWFRDIQRNLLPLILNRMVGLGIHQQILNDPPVIQLSR